MNNANTVDSANINLLSMDNVDRATELVSVILLLHI